MLEGGCFSKSFVEYLDALEEIGGTVDFENSIVKSLKSLKSIKGNVRFASCGVESLPSLVETGNIISINDKLGEFINYEFTLVDGKYVKKVRNNKR